MALGSSRPLSSARFAALEFQLQFVVPAEDLQPGYSHHDLQRLRSRVEAVLAQADAVLSVLEPRGWRLLATRFDDEVSVVLHKHATAGEVVRDLSRLPSSAQARIGNAVRLCASLGEHIFELALKDGGLTPLSPADLPG